MKLLPVLALFWLTFMPMFCVVKESGGEERAAPWAQLYVGHSLKPGT